MIEEEAVWKVKKFLNSPTSEKSKPNVVFDFFHACYCENEYTVIFEHVTIDVM